MDWLRKKDLLIYVTLIMGIVLAKLYHRSADSEDLIWILQPTVWLVTIFSGLAFEFVQEGFFMNYTQNIIIDKSCSGMNFMLIATCMLSFSYLPKLPFKAVFLVFFIILSYLFTIFVNSCRIIQSIWSQDILSDKLGLSPAMTHEMQGVFMYLFFLILLYLLSQFVFKQSMKKTYEKAI